MNRSDKQALSIDVSPNKYTEDIRASRVKGLARWAIFGAFLSNAYVTQQAPLEFTLSAIAGTVAFKGYTMAMRSRERRQLGKSINSLRDVSEITGEIIETIQDAEGNKSLIWSGSLKNVNDEANFQDRVYAINDIATAVDAKNIIILKNVLPGVLLENLELVSLKNMLSKYASLDTQDYEEDYVVFDRDDFAKSISVLLRSNFESEQTETISSIIDILRQIAPNNPLIRVYDTYGQGDDVLLHEMLRSTARTSLSMRLSDTVMARNPNTHNREKRHLYGAMFGSGHDTQILWIDQDGGSQVPESLSGFIGFDYAQLIELVNSKTLGPGDYEKIIIACEYLLTIKARVNESVTSSMEYEPFYNFLTTKEAVSIERLSIFQRIKLFRRNAANDPDITDKEILEYGSIEMSRKHKVLRFMAAIALLGAGAGIGVAEQKYIYEPTFASMYAQAEASLEANSSIENGGDVSKVVSEITKENPLIGTRALYEQYRRRIAIQLQATLTGSKLYSPPPDNRNTPPFDVGESGLSGSDIGNVEIGTTKLVWNLETYNGADASGYWVSDYYDFFGGDYWSKLPHVEKPKITTKVLPTTYTPEDGEQVIKVYNPIDELTIQSFTSDESARNNFNYASSLPVLSGYEIVAANVSGVPVMLYGSVGTNNKVTMAGDGPNFTGYITYWIKKTNSTTNLAQSYYKDNKTEPVKSYHYYKEYIDKIWNNFRGPEPGGNKPWLIDAQTIISTFTYDLQPLDPEGYAPNDYTNSVIDNQKIKGYLYEDEAKVVNLIDDVLQKKRAVCNVAATLMVTKYPKDLLYTSGFKNQKSNIDGSSKELVLSNNESHAWATDIHNNSIVDATPPDREGKYPDDFSEVGIKDINKPTDESGNNQLPIKEMMGMGLLALIAAASRKRVNKIYTKLGKKRLTKKANNLTQEEIDNAFVVANSVLYSRDNMPPKVIRKPSTAVSLERLAGSLPNDKQAIKLIEKNGGKKVSKVVKIAIKFIALTKQQAS